MISVLAEKPDAPSQPTVTDITPESASIKWEAPENDGGAPITNYVIEYRRHGDSKWLPASEGVTVTDLQFTISGLASETEYEFRVAAENKAGQGPFSPPSTPKKYGK